MPTGTNPYDVPLDREARQLAIVVAERCRAVGRPVALGEINIKRSNTDRHLLIRAVALGYLTAWPLPSATLYMPVGWGFGPEKGGCCR